MNDSGEQFKKFVTDKLVEFIKESQTSKDNSTADNATTLNLTLTFIKKDIQEALYFLKLLNRETVSDGCILCVVNKTLIIDKFSNTFCRIFTLFVTRKNLLNKHWLKFLKIT